MTRRDWSLDLRMALLWLAAAVLTRLEPASGRRNGKRG